MAKPKPAMKGHPLGRIRNVNDVARVMKEVFSGTCLPKPKASVDASGSQSVEDKACPATETAGAACHTDSVEVHDHEKTTSSSRKSLKTLSNLSPSQNILHGESDTGTKNGIGTKTANQKSIPIALSSLMAQNFLTKTENLIASIRYGLETIDNHHCTEAIRQSPLRLSLRPKDSKKIFLVHKVNVGVQAFVDDKAGGEDYVMTCNNCKSRMHLDGGKVDDNSNMQLVAVDCPESTDKPKK